MGHLPVLKLLGTEGIFPGPWLLTSEFFTDGWGVTSRAVRATIGTACGVRRLDCLLSTGYHSWRDASGRVLTAVMALHRAVAFRLALTWAELRPDCCWRFAGATLDEAVAWRAASSPRRRRWGAYSLLSYAAWTRSELQDADAIAPRAQTEELIPSCLPSY